MSRDQRQAFVGVVALFLGVLLLVRESDNVQRVDMPAESILVVTP